MAKSLLFGTLAFFTLIAIIKAGSPDFDYYHTTDQLEEAVDKIAAKCEFMTVSELNDEPRIRLIEINRNPEAEKQKVFLLFGEHAREMISPETGLQLLKTLCGQVESDMDVDGILNNNYFQIILNANPISRQKVEQGDYCLRVNENGVDLNRNWDDHWQTNEENSMQQTYGGPHPFSETETVTVKKALSNFEPTVFLTVHSGTKGMYTPYAWTTEEGTTNEDNMLQVTDNLNEKYCNCGHGSAAETIGYLSSGTCLDYAYDKLNIPYTFAWEIYAASDAWADEDVDQLLQDGGNLGSDSSEDQDEVIDEDDKEDDTFLGDNDDNVEDDTNEGDVQFLSEDEDNAMGGNFFGLTGDDDDIDEDSYDGYVPIRSKKHERRQLGDHQSSGYKKHHNQGFLQISNNGRRAISLPMNDKGFVLAQIGMMDMTPDECFDFFNPGNEALYRKTIHNWVNAILDMTQQVHSLEVLNNDHTIQSAKGQTVFPHQKLISDWSFT
eukprot:TRINITY_DN1864_c0_g4_i2.p1 TRINITY_DN1864_c0_g4~~TRINITY_DN1864_c0_g4_i2.p1  ORF type:complete len:494 (-),score=170.00 TRINITY_DN1864_c0_g4_i2:173-1654(-)